MEKVTVLGIDIAKQVFHVAGMNERGRVVMRKKLYRSELSEFMVQLPQTVIGIEACTGAHYWTRAFQGFGHEVRLFAPKFVRAYVKSNKNDSADAEAIAEAVSRENMRFVPVNTQQEETPASSATASAEMDICGNFSSTVRVPLCAIERQRLTSEISGSKT